MEGNKNSCSKTKIDTATSSLKSYVLWKSYCRQNHCAFIVVIVAASL